MTAAVISLTNCQPKELATDEPILGKTVLISASIDADTKTTASGMSTLWAEGDKINLYYGSSYTDLGEVTIAEGAGTKQATFEVANAPTSSVKWYAFYPYNSHRTTPAESECYTTIGHRVGLNQDGWDNTGALCGTVCPLYGVAEGVAGEFNIPMKHLASAIELNLTNNTGSDIVVNTVTVTGSEDIVGSYFIDITGDTPTYSPSDGYVSSSAVVNMEDSTLEDGESGKVYLAIKPYTQSESQPFTVKISATVDGDLAETTIELHPSGAQCVFTAGKMKKVNVNIASIDVVSGNTVAEALATADETFTLKKVQITSIVGNNIFVKDNTGVILVYLQSVSDLAVGDYVSVVGKTKAWNNLTEFDKPTVTKISSGSFSQTPTTWTDSQMAAAYGNAQVKYVTYQAVFTKNRNATIPGSEAILYTTNHTGITQNAGGTYKVTGYVYGWTLYQNTTKEVCMFVETCEEVAAAPTETQVVFDFNDGLSDMGLSAPTAGEPGDPVDSFSQDGVTIKAYNSTNNTPVRIFLGTAADAKPTLRAYKGSAIVITAPAGKNITKVSPNSNATSSLADGEKCAAVTLYYTGSATINKLTVTLDDDTVVPGIGGAVASVGPDASSNNTLTILCGGYSSAPNTTVTKDGTVVTAASVSNKTKDSMTLSFTVSKNSGTEAREGWVKITSGSYVATINVTQQGLNFNVSKSEVYVDAKSGSSATLTVRSDANWTAQLSGSGYSVSPESFEYNGETATQLVTVSATDDNTTTSEKTLGTFTIKRTDNASQSVTVIQRSCKLAAPTISLEANGSAKTIVASWNAVPNASGYKYKLSTQSSYTETTETSVTFSGLTVGTTYTVSVIALGDGDPYVDSDEATAEVKLTSTSSTVTFSFPDLGFANGDEVTTVTKDGVTISFDKGTNTQNGPKYYNTGTAVRVYGGNTFKVSASKAITKIDFTFSSGEGTNAISASPGTFTSPTWTGSSSSVNFTIEGTTGHRRIKEIKVTM